MCTAHTQLSLLLSFCECYMVSDLGLWNGYTICKPPNKLSFVGNTAQNWQEFEEQLRWFLAGTESAEKSDQFKPRLELCCPIWAKRLGRRTKSYSEIQKVIKISYWGTKVLLSSKEYQFSTRDMAQFWSLHQEDDKSIVAYLTRI